MPRPFEFSVEIRVLCGSDAKFRVHFSFATRLKDLSYLLAKHIGDLAMDGILSHQLELRVWLLFPNRDFGKRDVDRPIPEGKLVRAGAPDLSRSMICS
jgi:hypothetical protein